MNSIDDEPSQVAKWDPDLTERLMGWVRPVIKGYHRAEVRGLEAFPPGGALVVSNHSGGMFTVDIPAFATGFYEKFGYDRPIYTLSHDLLMALPTDYFVRTGFIRASHDNADHALRSGGVVVVFPGGDYDACRPTLGANKIDFGGRTGYVRAALNAGVPLVPMVGIGGQETQLFLSRGRWLAKALRLDKALGAKQVPLAVGFPFGLSVGGLPVNVPLPTKIVQQVLPPIDVIAGYGENPDIQQVDAHVRAVMQLGLDELARRRRLPVIG